MSNSQPGETGFKAFYKGKSCEVWATSSYQAQKKAATILKAKKSYDVTVVACERADGSQIVHSTAGI